MYNKYFKYIYTTIATIQKRVFIYIYMNMKKKIDIKISYIFIHFLQNNKKKLKTQQRKFFFIMCFFYLSFNAFHVCLHQQFTYNVLFAIFFTTFIGKYYGKNLSF